MKRNVLIWLVTLTVATCSMAQDNWCRFSDDIAGYSLQYPCHWKVQDHSESSGMIRADFSDQSVGFQVRKYKNNMELERFFQLYLKQFIEDMEGHWGGKAVIKGKASTDGYIQAIVVLERADGQVWEFWEYVFEGNDHFIAFQCGVREYESDSGSAIFKHVARSLRFKD